MKMSLLKKCDQKEREKIPTNHQQQKLKAADDDFTSTLIVLQNLELKDPHLIIKYCTSPEDNIVFPRLLSHEELLQNAAQNGHQIFGLDGNFKSNKYKLLLSILGCVCGDQLGAPISMMVANALGEEAKYIEWQLRITQELITTKYMIQWNPTIMIDMSAGEMKGVTAAGFFFKLCHFHLAKNAKEHLPKDTSVASKCLAAFYKLIRSCSESEFISTLNEFEAQIEASSFWTYIRRQYVEKQLVERIISDNVIYGLSKTSNFIESMFRVFTLIFLRSKSANRVDTLVQKLYLFIIHHVVRIEKWRKNVQLGKVKRQKTMTEKSFEDVRRKAETLFVEKSLLVEEEVGVQEEGSKLFFVSSFFIYAVEVCGLA